ncbi:MAG TPA: hypothetical protein VLG11_03710 [Candidatus Saccharimonadales bacterium]|nr:hypothetical protein [Candidatus Saccharimonadales bacterium]
MKRVDSFVLPSGFEPQGDMLDAVRAAHEQYISMGIDDIRRISPEATRDPEHGITFVDYEPREAYDRAHALVIQKTSGNGHGLNWACRLRLLQDCLPEPTRIISFPSPSTRPPVGMRATDHIRETILLNQAEIDEVTAGNFAPIGRRQAGVLRKLKVQQVQEIGYSQGASIGAGVLPIFADQFEVGHSGLFEPANLQARSERALKFAHTASALGFIQAVHDTALPVFEELQEVRPRDLLRQLYKSIRFRRGDKTMPLQQTLESGLSGDGFLSDVSDFLEKKGEAHLLVVRGSKSRVATAQGFEHLRTLQSDRLHTLEVPHYGHGLGNNLALFALLSTAALNNIVLDARHSSDV